MGEGEPSASDRAELERLGIDPSAPGAADTLKLARYLLDRGATAEDVREAARTGTLGPLALELALGPPGEPVPFAEAAERAGMDPDEAAALWRALGFPDPLTSDVTLTSSQIDTLRVLGGMGRSVFGRETTEQIARVIGGSVALLAEAIVDSFRVNVEMPRTTAGEPYSEVVQDYAQMASAMFPALTAAVADVLRTHIVSVASSSWAPDEDRAAVTRDRTVGFIDLVDYTSRSRALSPAALAAIVGRFESRVGDAVERRGGRVVKLIGDEAMFVIDDPAEASELALELATWFREDEELPEVRVGLAAGPVVSHHGDYFGEVVNLAARLVKVAGVGEVFVSESVAEKVGGRVAAEPAAAPRLKGYDADVAAFRLRDPEASG